jgi:hypothetical protein
MKISTLSISAFAALCSVSIANAKCQTPAQLLVLAIDSRFVADLGMETFMPLLRQRFN